MKMKFKQNGYLSICIFMLLSWYGLLADNSVGVMVKVKTPYENFSKRLEVQIKGGLEKHKKFDQMDRPSFGGQQAFGTIRGQIPSPCFSETRDFLYTFKGFT